MLPVVALVSLSVGTVNFSFFQIIETVLLSMDGYSEPSQIQSIIMDIRLPRLILALLVGASLAILGAVMQGLFRNPLADPSLIGVSGGASVGASIVIVAAGGAMLSPLAGLSMVALGAFIGGAITTLVVYRVATSSLGTSVTTMLLAGIAIGAIAGAFNSLLSYFSDNQMLRQISIWQMGNLGGANWQKVSIMASVSLVIFSLLPSQARSLNALLLGESEARHLGIDVQRIKRQLIFLTALGVGVSVALAGLIGFVGLIVPHMVRLLIGPDHRALLPASALAGASLLLIADSIARVVVLPAELPTGILTALLGAPFFVALLLKQRGQI
ncbi:MAG: FecCD family ABC transporter permease [Porticoccaceae bacterium]